MMEENSSHSRSLFTSRADTHCHIPLHHQVPVYGAQSPHVGAGTPTKYLIFTRFVNFVFFFISLNTKTNLILKDKRQIYITLFESKCWIFIHRDAALQSFQGKKLGFIKMFSGERKMVRWRDEKKMKFEINKSQK